MEKQTRNREIFVFGSNLAGRHGSGSARFAMDHHGAEYGVGIGLTGNSYAIPTKDSQIKTLPLANIREYVKDFIQFAKDHPEMEFKIVKVGCGLAGYDDEDIAPMFRGSPENCIFHEDWEYFLK